MEIKKRDGSVVPFKQEKITLAIFKAAQACGGNDFEKAEEISNEVVQRLKNSTPIGVEDIQNLIEKVLMERGHTQTARAFILYREKHKQAREKNALIGATINMFNDYLDDQDWRIQENANTTRSISGLNNFVREEFTKNYWLHEIYPNEIRQAHEQGDFHIHDLGFLGNYCNGWSLQQLLQDGWGIPGKVNSKPAKHLRSFLGQIVNSTFTTQGESSGAQAWSNFDTLCAPFIRQDKLDYGQVKQALQEFVYNLNVPTRVGGQCLSEDTEILTENGWRGCNDVVIGDTIATFNIDNQDIEYLPVKKMYKEHYKGVMYSIHNVLNKQLISPGHRVVQKRKQTDECVLTPIEKLNHRKHFNIPIKTGGCKNGGSIDPNIVKLIAWVVAEGSIDKSRRRITIYQSKVKHPEYHKEIKDLLDNFGYTYTEANHDSDGVVKGLCDLFSLSTKSSLKLLELFGAGNTEIRHIPTHFLRLNSPLSKLFIDTYMKADGSIKSRTIATIHDHIKEAIMHIAINAGYGCTNRIEQPTKLMRHPINLIRIIKNKTTLVRKKHVKKVPYDGVIWCPTTDNGTVIARRKEKTFITGNCPFSNITMDITPPNNLKDVAVVIGGEMQSTTYGEYQEEMDILNQAFCEVMLEGDSSGRGLTFPIPTLNVTKTFPWESKTVTEFMKLTGKYGSCYFSNYINTDNNPDDALSLCCRLRLSTKELKKRGGGLFGSNPLTGSIGVVTLNLPRAAKGQTPDEFLNKLKELCTLAKDSLEIKRKIIEEQTRNGLYPYSAKYLKAVFDRTGEYWSNHFNTIGLVGMNEACIHLFGDGIAYHKEFAEQTLNYLRDLLLVFQEETGHQYNLEATPAEGTCYSLAKKDGGEFVYYTNSTQLPVNYTDNIFTALDHQDTLQSLYTGGTVQHLYLGERIEDPKACAELIKVIFTKYKLPYISITPTFSVCEEHGYIVGNVERCPKCNAETEVWSRVTGYLRPVKNYNPGKKQEFKERKTYVLKGGDNIG